MQNKLKNFFTNDHVLYLMPFLFVIFEVASELMYFINGWFDWVYTVERVILAVCVILLAVAYKNHDKNVMKPLLGAVLLGILFSDLPYAADMFGNHSYYISTVGGIWTVYEIMEILVLLGYAGILASHLVINTAHRSNPGKIRHNQALTMLTLAVYLVQVVVCLLTKRTALFMAAKITSFLANVVLLNLVICIESKLDMFRMKREENGWTEE